jgi:hypothetical protein
MTNKPADLYLAAGWLWRDADLYRWVERYSSNHHLPFEVVSGTERSQVLVLRFPDQTGYQEFLKEANAAFPWVDFV